MSYWITCPKCEAQIQIIDYRNNTDDSDCMVFCNSCGKEFEAIYIDGELKVKEKGVCMEKLKYKVDDEVLIKGKVIEVKDPDEHIYPYKVRFEYNNIALAWADSVPITSIAGTVDEFVKVGEDQKTYEQGLNDAWEMAKNITIGLELCKLQTIYDGFDTMSAIVQRYSAQEAINKYNAWKERNDIKMGDIVEYDIDERTICRSIYLYEGFNCHWVLTSDYEAPQQLPKTYFKLRKVGESGLDIAGALAKVREMEG